MGKRLFDPTARHRFVLLVTGMGDQNAVGLATAAHLNVLRARSLLSAAEMLAFNVPGPRSLQWSGVYIDDWLLVRLVKRCQAKRPDVGSELAQAVSEAYVAAGLPEETDKAFNTELDFRSWGAELKGGIGTLAAPRSSRFQRFQITLEIIKFGCLTKHILKNSLGFSPQSWFFGVNVFQLSSYVPLSR